MLAGFGKAAPFIAAALIGFFGFLTAFLLGKNLQVWNIRPRAALVAALIGLLCWWVVAPGESQSGVVAEQQAAPNVP